MKFSRTLLRCASLPQCCAQLPERRVRSFGRPSRRHCGARVHRRPHLAVVPDRLPPPRHTVVSRLALCRCRHSLLRAGPSKSGAWFRARAETWVAGSPSALRARAPGPAGTPGSPQRTPWLTDVRMLPLHSRSLASVGAWDAAARALNVTSSLLRRRPPTARTFTRSPDPTRAVHRTRATTPFSADVFLVRPARSSLQALPKPLDIGVLLHRRLQQKLARPQRARGRSVRVSEATSRVCLPLHHHRLGAIPSQSLPFFTLHSTPPSTSTSTSFAHSLAPHPSAPLPITPLSSPSVLIPPVPSFSSPGSSSQPSRTRPRRA